MTELIYPKAPPAGAGISDIAETIEVSAPIQQVWDVLADTSRYADWVKDCLAVTYHHGTATLGGIYKERNVFLGPIRASTTWTVAELEAPFYRRDTGIGMPLLSELEAIFELEPLTPADGPEATRWTYRNRYRVGLGAVGRRIDGLQQGELRKMMRASMAALSDLVLQSGGADR